MPHRTVRASMCFLLLLTGAARAASAQTCIRIESADMLAPNERTAALLLVQKQFELAGHRVAETGCQTTYTLSHIRLGSTIIVTIAGATGSREGKALGLDDLPAVYSQLVRSLTTGQPMGTLAVLDRTNVSAAQDLPPRRVQSDGYWHARVGYASLFGPTTHPAASFGFGYRAAFDRLGLDMSFLNFQLDNSGSYYAASSSVISLIKLEGLYFTSPTANRSAYFGGGVSYGRTEIRNANGADFPATGRGAGLQGELTAGYEIGRVTAARLFVQADVTLPFYDVAFETFSYPGSSSGGPYVPPTITTEQKYAPSLTFSIGLGWQRRNR
ncbi:MAG TPA: hypothetical protein VES67_02405 [Vicinamibacterales bacterium]|nr:hypothetical protein [Vicinamibacterales bacterium]